MIYILTLKGTPTSCGDVATMASELGCKPIDLIDPAYLAKLSGTERELAEEGFNIPDESVVNLPDNAMRVTEADWAANGSLCRLVDGKIVLGKPADQITEEAEAAIRSERDRLLRACDKISPMRWNVMTDEQKLAWADYRQALLDIPQQDGFPWDGDIAKAPWPVKPEA